MLISFTEIYNGHINTRILLLHANAPPFNVFVATKFT